MINSRSGSSGMSVAVPNSKFSDQSKELMKGSKRKCSTSESSDSSDVVLRDLLRKPKRFKLNDLDNSNGKHESSVVIRAEELQSKLDSRYPSFVKHMLKSHVTGGFWLGLPAPFCQKYLPKKDIFLTLETQSKKSCEAKYLACKRGLSGGWRGFALSERLLMGDVLVFHLLSTTKFKVYIIRENDLAGVDGALFLLKLDKPVKQNDIGVLTKSSKGKELAEVEHTTMHTPDNTEGNTSTKYPSMVAYCLNNKEESLTSNVVEMTFDDFCIVIRDLLKEFELPRQIKKSYYKLCCSQNAFLHDSLPTGMNHILISGVIMETVTIADSLKECELPSFMDESEAWGKALQSLELLGMNVGFLRDRLHCLKTIAHDSEVATLRQKCLDLCSEHVVAKEEIRSLKARLSKMKKVQSKHAADISDLKSKIENHELEYQEQVQVPW